jgi:hypothetical protein
MPLRSRQLAGSQNLRDHQNDLDFDQFLSYFETLFHPFKQFELIVPSTLYGTGRRPFWFFPWDLAKQESKMVFLWYGHMGYVWIYPTKEQLWELFSIYFCIDMNRYLGLKSPLTTCSIWSPNITNLYFWFLASQRWRTGISSKMRARYWEATRRWEKHIPNDSQNEDLESAFNKDSCRCSNS